MTETRLAARPRRPPSPADARPRPPGRTSAPPRYSARSSHSLSQGHETPCAGRGDLWTADDRKTRLAVAPLCNACPVVGVCGADADEAHTPHGAWGGTDRTLGRWSE